MTQFAGDAIYVVNFFLALGMLVGSGILAGGTVVGGILLLSRT